MEFGCIGHPLGHSFSAELHGKIGMYSYELCDLPPEELPAFLEKREFRGINVTIPYKQTVLPYLDFISPAARAIGAVNTVVNRNGKLLGYNTDFAGLADLLRKIGYLPGQGDALILGTGGTSRTACAVLQSLGEKRIFRVSRTGRESALTYEQASSHQDTALILNATPSGMFPENDGSPLSPEAFPNLKWTADAVYNPLRTRLVLDSRRLGIPASGGLYMLTVQAVVSSRLFLGGESEAAEDDVLRLSDEIHASLLREKENIVLIGMPTCGKTTVGRLLSQVTGRPFADSDEELTLETGKTPEEWILSEGEEAFRRAESETVARLSVKNGGILATGGGIVLRPENLLRLRQNGRLYFIHRPLESLHAGEGRPLSSDPTRLAALYETRLPLYRAAADGEIAGDKTPEQIASEILTDFEKGERL